MLRNLLTAAALGAVAVALPVQAANTPTDTTATAPAAAPAPKSAFSVDETDIGTLLDNPATKAVLDKLLPGLSTNPQIDMARAMTLKQVQGYAPDKIKDEALVQVQAELAKIPAK
jgi:para-nitrobenzyl esterase